MSASCGKFKGILQKAVRVYGPYRFIFQDLTILKFIPLT